MASLGNKYAKATALARLKKKAQKKASFLLGFFL